MNNLKEIGNRYYKECNIIPRETLEETNIVKFEDKSNNILKYIYYPDDLIKQLVKESRLYSYVYIDVTSNDEIKEGDWFMFYGEVRQAKDLICQPVSQGKIIATTDKSLFYTEYNTLKHSVTEKEILPQPSQSFIKKYCELGGIDKVLVEYELINNNPEFDISSMFVEYQARLKALKSASNLEEYKLKTDSHNTITIKSVKNSWTREEVINKIRMAVENEDLVEIDVKVWGEEVDAIIHSINEDNFNNWIAEHM